MKLNTLLLIAVVVFGCKSNEKEQNDYIKISQTTPSLNDIIEFDNYFEISELIYLESNDTSIIDFIHKIVADDYLFIKGGGAVYKFDKEGNFISKIERGKDGPNEFKNLTDIILLKEEKRIWIYDSNKRNILQYDYDFNFEINYKLQYPFFGIEKITDGLLGTAGYMMVTDKPNSLIKFSGENLATGYSLEESFLPFEEEKSKYLHVGRNDYFSKSDKGGFNFINSFNDTIYHIDESGIPKIEYYIDFGNKKVSEDDLTKREYSTIVDVFRYINTTDKSFNIGNVFQSNNFLTFSFFNSGKSFISVYNKTDRSLVSGNKIKLRYRDVETVISIDEEMSIGSFGDGRGYISLPTESILLEKDQKMFDSKEGDNPVIIIFHEK
jgi:hypothetical protein